MSRYSELLRRSPHRATIINAILLSLLMLMINDAAVQWLIGVVVLALAGLWILRRALVRTLSAAVAGDSYHLILTWVPGLLAVSLALLGLHLMVTDAGATPNLWLGWILFTVELVMLVVIGADLSPSNKSSFGAGARA